MKIYYSIIIGFIFFCCVAFTSKYYASTWSGTANNETVSRNALADAVANTIFYQKAAFTGSTRQTTKAEAAAWVYLNESSSPFAGKASNQLVIKTDLVAATPIYITIGSSYDGGTGLTISITVSAALPQSMDITFSWCTDSGADGDVTFSLPSSFSGTTTATANLSMTGSVSGTYVTAGSVLTSSPSIVNEMYVKGATLVVTTSDNSRPYLITYTNVDNTCTSVSTVTDECLNCSGS